MSSALPDDEEEDVRPVRQTLCGSLAKDANWKCLVLSLLIYACLGAVTWCRTAEVTKVIINLSLYPIRSTRLTSPCEDGYMYVPVAFLAMLYLLYLVECWHCTAGGGAAGAWAGGGSSGRLDAARVLQKIQEMREAQPVVWWKAVCYHYVRRKRQVTRYRHGDAYTSTQVYYERINSHAAGACFVYAYCGVKDISPRLLLDRAGPITKIRFSKGFAFANVEAAAEFEEQRARFFAEHERRDDYVEMREGLELAAGAGLATSSPPGPGPFRETATAFADPASPPWFTSPLAFWLSSCLLLSWPLRLLVEYNTAYVHYQVTKLFGVNYEVPSSATPTSGIASSLPGPGAGLGSGGGGGLSRGSTIDSADLDWTIRDNCAIVPSYSEALLMLPSATSPAAQAPPAAAAAIVPAILQVTVPAPTTPSATTDAALSPLSPTPNGAPLAALQCDVPSPSPLLSRSSTHGRLGLVLYFATPLAERRPDDPFGGRALTTPTEDPPPYEDALRLPALPALHRLRRSFTERGELCRRGGSGVAAAATTAASTAASAAASLLWLRPRRSEPAPGGAVVADVQQVRLARARLSMETSL